MGGITRLGHRDGFPHESFSRCRVAGVDSTAAARQTGIGLLADLRHVKVPIENYRQITQKTQRKDECDRNGEYHGNDGEGAIVSGGIQHPLSPVNEGSNPDGYTDQ